MSQEKMVEIASMLLEQSRQKKVDWSEILGAENRFFVAYSDYTIRITETHAGHHILSVHSKKGTELESLAPPNITDDGKILSEIFKIARRNVLKSEDVLDDVLNRLRQESTPT